MLSRAAKLVSVPASVTVLCALAIPVPTQITSRFNAPEQPVVVQPMAQPSPELPRLIAVDKRIARRLNALRPSVKQRLQRVVRKLPRNVTLMVTSATRTRAEQASLRSTFGVKAAPGTSTHEDGRAVDVNVFVNGERVRPRRQNKIIGEAMASEGFRYLGAMDPVHYSIPKESIDVTLTRGPELEVPTMRDLIEIKAQVEEQKVVAAVDSGLAQP
ncbi:MAG: hypothetical protein K0Q72_3170 [Armatimonadetes bacterium]|nr:hypothetical protein [Armatimonadota bacterium]